MITWHARVYNLRKYRPTTANYIKLGKSGTRRSPALTPRYGGFDKGRRLIRLPAIGLPPDMPASARYEPPRGFPCQIRRGPGRWSRIAARVRTSAFRASRPALGPSGVKLQRRAGRGRRVGGACGPAGRLEDVQKALTGQTGDTRLRRLASSRETTHYERHATPPHMR